MLRKNHPKTEHAQFLLHSPFNRVSLCSHCRARCLVYQNDHINKLRASHKTRCSLLIVQTVERVRKLAKPYMKQVSRLVTLTVEDAQFIVSFLTSSSNENSTQIFSGQLQQRDMEEAYHQAQGLYRREKTKADEEYLQYQKKEATEQPHELLQVWRQLFLDQMQPRFFPDIILRQWNDTYASHTTKKNLANQPPPLPNALDQVGSLPM